MLFCTSACLACGAWFVGFIRLPLHLIADSLVLLADNVSTSDVVVPDRVLLDRSDPPFPALVMLFILLQTIPIGK